MDQRHYRQKSNDRKIGLWEFGKSGLEMLVPSLKVIDSELFLSQHVTNSGSSMESSKKNTQQQQKPRT